MRGIRFNAASFAVSGSAQTRFFRTLREAWSRWVRLQVGELDLTRCQTAATGHPAVIAPNLSRRCAGGASADFRANLVRLRVSLQKHAPARPNAAMLSYDESFPVVAPPLI